MTLSLLKISGRCVSTVIVTFMLGRLREFALAPYTRLGNVTRFTDLD